MSTPLHLAAAVGRVFIVKALLYCSADVTVHNSKGQVPLDVCASALEPEGGRWWTGGVADLGMASHGKSY